MQHTANFLINKASIPRNILGNPKGLSLLETLIAIIILALALASISYFFSQARGNIQTFGHMRSGLVLAQDKMEQLKDLGYSHADLSEDNNPHSDQVNSMGDADANGAFYREWTVTPIDDPADSIGGDTDYKLVDLKVYDQRLSPAEALTHDDKLVAELKTYISP